MGTKYLAAIRQDIRYRLGLSASDPKFDNDIADMYINSALSQLNNMRDWWWNEASRTFSTVADTELYDFAADHRKTQYLAIDDNQLPFRSKLDMIKYEDFTGQPRFWTVEAGQLRLFPTPDVVYTVTEVYQMAETLVDDLDTTSWPDWAVDLVVVKAALNAAPKVRPEMIPVLAPELQSIYDSLKDDTIPASEGFLPRRRNDWRP